MSAPPPLTFISPTLIGRQHALAALQVLIEQKQRGEGPAILISGEAGIGKSRLVAEAITTATHQGFLLLEGQCFQGDSAFPYAPLLDLFRSYFARFAPNDPSIHLRAFISTLARLLPDMALLFPDLATSPALPSSGPEEEKHRLFAAMTHLLTEQAAQRPILLVVEDIHWGDDLSLGFLLHLARRCRHLPLLLLITYRSDALHPGVQQWLTQLDRERLTRELPLGPLSRSEIGTMVRAILAPEHAVDAELLDMLATLSEGNPFFVEELLKSLMAAGQLQYVDGTWVRGSDAGAAGGSSFIPRSVHVAVQQQADRLSAAAKQVLTLAAVAGRRFDFPMLQQALRCDEAYLLSLMKELMAAQLVVEESADQFAFRHALIQQAIYSGLLVRERQALHRTLAETLEQLSTTPSLRERYLGDMAAHCYEAGMWEQAMVYERQVGEHALTLYAPRAAIGHLTRVVDAAQRLLITPPSKVYYARGQAYGTLGEFDRAQSDYQRALDIARTAPDGVTEWQSMMALGFLWAERDYAQAGAWFRRARDLAEDLADPTLQARSLNRLGNWLVNTGRLEEGLQAHRAALGMFEDQHDTLGMAETFDLLGTAHGMHGEKAKAVEQLGQAIALFRTLGDTQGLISSLTMRALQSMPGSSETTLCPLRTREECVQDAAESLRLARQIESLAGQAYAETALAHILLSFGEFGPALSHAQEAQRIAAEIEHQQWLVAALYALGNIYLLLLAPTQAMTAVEAGVSLAQELGSTFWLAMLAALQGRIYVLQHNLPAAQATLQAIMPREQQPQTMAERQIALVWGELALARREPEMALQIAERLLASVPGQVSGQPAQPIPHLLKLKGKSLLALARLEDAIAVLEEARQGAVARNTRPVLWAIHRSLGQAYHRFQRPEQARKEHAAARRLIEELAASISEASLRDQFLRAALDSLPQEQPPRPREAARQAFGGLTAREREVAALIAQGKTSREIADLLVISERTAEVHVSNILRKLDFTSRAQIAAWFVKRGLAAR
jgi:DNA-binding CsgD family transcriptional regulator/Tfp pilus assembly protein PilF